MLFRTLPKGISKANSPSKNRKKVTKHVSVHAFESTPPKESAKLIPLPRIEKKLPNTSAFMLFRTLPKGISKANSPSKNRKKVTKHVSVHAFESTPPKESAKLIPLPRIEKKLPNTSAFMLLRALPQRNQQS